MKLLLLCSILLILVTACSDPEQGSMIEEKKALQSMRDISEHPLARFFTPYGYEPLNYIGKFWGICDPEHPAYTESNCDKAVERGIRVGASIGIKLEKEDLENPKYWAMHQSLLKLKFEHEQNYYKNLGRKVTPMDRKKYRDDYREKVTDLMANMDDS